MSKIPKPAYLSEVPPKPKDSRYQNTRIAAYHHTQREMSESDHNRREKQLQARLKGLHKDRLPWMPSPNVLLGHPNENGKIYTQVIIYGPVTEEDLWAIENATIVTLVGPEGDIELITETGQMERVEHNDLEP